MSTNAKFTYAIVIILLFAAGMWVASQGFLQNQDKGPTPYAALGGDFTLEGIDGTVKLSDYQGKLVVIYFGFMSCPDVCPTALSGLSSALRSLPEADQAKVQPLFVSVDPERDTLERMAEFTAFFFPTMKGLTGELPYLEKLVRQYGAYFRHVPMENSSLGYTVDHTSRLYIIDQHGVLIETVPHNTPVEEIEALLKQHL